MKVNQFNNLCLQFVGIGQIQDQKEQDRRLNEIMSCGYLFLDLTEKQVKTLKSVLISHFPRHYKLYKQPDNQGFTGEFLYLRFK